MALIKKVAKYGSNNCKCIVLSKDIRALINIKDYISITVDNNKLIIEAIKDDSIKNKT
ncbi:MAG: hypothetical protein PVH88_08935 [Ignavibacteria bacterium]|jgi:hypothetical protein